MGRSSLRAAVPCQGWCGPSQSQPPYGTPHLGLSGGAGVGDDVKKEEGHDMKEEEGQDMNKEEGDDVKE